MGKDDQLKIIGNRIRERRESAGLSQEALAFAVGYKSRTSINKIELGKTDIVQSVIKKIADALSTTPAYIMGWSDNPFPEKKPTPVSEDRLNEEQLEIVRLYEAAPPALRAAALAVLRAAEDPDKVPGGVSTAE